MKKNKIDIGKFGIRLIQLCILILIFFLLFATYDGTYREDVFRKGNPSNSVTIETHSISHNFFDRMTNNFDNTFEILFLISLGICVFITILSMLSSLRILSKIYFAAIPLLSTILFFIFTVDNDGKFMGSIVDIYYYSNNTYYQRSGIKYDLWSGSAVIVFILLLLVVLLKIVDSLNLLEKINFNREKIEHYPNANDNTTKNTTNNNIDEVSELKKYKDLLDSEIITQEEFDAKKKELFGL